MYAVWRDILFFIADKPWFCIIPLKMEAIKKKFAEESPEDKKTRQKNLVLPSVGCLAICTAMVVIGNQAFSGGSINLGGWKNLSGQIKNSGQLMWADKIIYVGE